MNIYCVRLSVDDITFLGDDPAGYDQRRESVAKILELWCEKNCNEKTFSIAGSGQFIWMYFEEAADATAFKLRWKS